VPEQLTSVRSTKMWQKIGLRAYRKQNLSSRYVTKFEGTGSALLKFMILCEDPRCAAHGIKPRSRKLLRVNE